MRLRRLTIRNFRGVRDGKIDFPAHALLVGGNNTGKSTVCEALELLLGPERLFRRPVVDEHDFYRGQYRATAEATPDSERSPNDSEGPPADSVSPEPDNDWTRSEQGVIRIDGVLIDLSEEAERRFRGHLRRWNEAKGDFVDKSDSPSPEEADAEATSWALPVGFCGRYNAEEDQFEGGTFFLHPEREVREEDASNLGAGLASFSREDKRFCGFVFLRALRTGSRALTLQRGSLLDTILRLSGGSTPEMWVNTLEKLQGLSPPIGDIPQLRTIQEQIERRARRFVGLAPGNTTAFFASELTREHLREVVRLFVASEESAHLVPFHRLGTGTVNVLVFALLTFIADLKSERSVIFAMEEPEIALPPHTQRRVVNFVLREMGQALVTSHSPYVIEQFDSGDIVILSRHAEGVLRGKALEEAGVTTRMLRSQRRQFAEAVLARAVLVVEGGTEVALCHAVSTALERFRPDAYMHLDLAGVTVFDAGGDRGVPKFGPVFDAMDKPAFALFDKQKTAWSEHEKTRLASYQDVSEHTYDGAEELLVAEVPVTVHRVFLEQAALRTDYPQTRKYSSSMSDEEVLSLSREVLRARKGEGSPYSALLVACCTSVDELPGSIVGLLMTVHEQLQREDEVSAPPDGGRKGDKSGPKESPG